MVTECAWRRTAAAGWRALVRQQANEMQMPQTSATFSPTDEQLAIGQTAGGPGIKQRLDVAQDGDR